MARFAVQRMYILVIMIVVWAFILGPIHLHFLHLPVVNRIYISVLLIFPIGFLMGIPFPITIRMLSRGKSELIPWAWGINGFASVAGAPVGLLLSMSFGFSRALAVAAILYAAAALVVPYLPGSGQPDRRAKGAPPGGP